MNLEKLEVVESANYEKLIGLKIVLKNDNGQSFEMVSPFDKNCSIDAVISGLQSAINALTRSKTKHESK